MNRRRAGLARAGGGVAVLEQGQRLDRVAGDGPGEDGAGAVGGREAHLAAGAQGPAISRRVTAGSSTTSST